jgi:D-ribose pyranose/furanose isomerase RbsD
LNFDFKGAQSDTDTVATLKTAATVESWRGAHTIKSQQQQLQQQLQEHQQHEHQHQQHPLRSLPPCLLQYRVVL